MIDCEYYIYMKQTSIYFWRLNGETSFGRLIRKSESIRISMAHAQDARQRP
jgi:hypothetical protein